LGARTARITAEDFLIPPEFRGYRLAERSAGQVGGVALELTPGPAHETGPRTRLGACYQQMPVRVLPPFHFAGEPAALLYLINPTAGLMDGDGHLVEVDAGPGTRTVLTGQSANRVHPAVVGFATQQWRLRIARGAQLVVLPGPNIPFRGCRYHQRVEVDLEPGASFLWGEIWTPGRYDRGALSERHQFERIVQELEVSRGGTLVYRDRFDWRGPWDAATASWHVGDGPAASAASLFHAGPIGTPPRPHLGVDRAVLPLASGDTLIRWCGPPPSLIDDVVGTALRLAAAWSGGPGAPPWLLAANHLGPNHWFSAVDGRNG
jgi:urease accessory protein